MMVSVAQAADRQAEFVRRRVPCSSPLTHLSDVGGNVQIGVDLLTPGQWRTVSFVAIDETSEPVLNAVLGDSAVDELRADGSAGQDLVVNPATAAAWLRIAVVDALDRWLHTPLDQCVLDAERGVSRGRAASSLPAGPARALLVADALRLSRRAARDLAALLRRLSTSPARLPTELFDALQRLVDGYAELLGEVEQRRDAGLKAVLDGWRRIEDADPPRLDPPIRGPASADAARPAGTHVVDPRQLPARVVGLSDEPAVAEITTAVHGEGLRVQVPRFGSLDDADARARLVARLVERRTGRPKGHAPLTPVTDGFAATVPLNGMDPADVRADVFDVFFDRPPARSDTDTALQEARRAVTFLAEWRRLVGIAKLSSPSAPLARRLRELAERIRPGFEGGPSPSDLDALAELGDDELHRALRSQRTDGPFAITRGAAGLLVAELVALHLAATP